MDFFALRAEAGCVRPGGAEITDEGLMYLGDHSEANAILWNWSPGSNGAEKANA